MRGIRRPILAAAIASIVLVAALLCWYFLSQGSGSAPIVRHQEASVLLVGRETTGEGRRARELAVMAVPDEGNVIFLVIPSELIVKLEDGTLVEIGAAYAERSEAETRSAVGALLGIELAGTIAWDEAGLTGLVDELGGVTMTVQEPVVDRRSGMDGEIVVEVDAGERTLDGNEALAYLRGSSDLARTTRQQRFLGALIETAFVGGGTRSPRAIAEAIEPFVETELPVSTRIDFCAALSEGDPGQLQAPILPTEIVALDGEDELHLRVVEAERIVARLVRGLELLTPSEVSIAVFNGNGVRLMASRTADYLRARGFEVTRIANAESFDYRTSYIVVLGDEAKAWVLRDALPSSVSIVFPEMFEDHYNALSGLVPFGTDLLLIIGAGMEIE